MYYGAYNQAKWPLIVILGVVANTISLSGSKNRWHKIISSHLLSINKKF